MIYIKPKFKTQINYKTLNMKRVSTIIRVVKSIKMFLIFVIFAKHKYVLVKHKKMWSQWILFKMCLYISFQIKSSDVCVSLLKQSSCLSIKTFSLGILNNSSISIEHTRNEKSLKIFILKISSFFFKRTSNIPFWTDTSKRAWFVENISVVKYGNPERQQQKVKIK